MARIRPDLMMIDGGYEPLVTVIAQAVAASPVVVNTPANVAPSTTEALKVAEKVAAAVAPIIAPDVSDSKLSQIAKQTTTAVVTNPAVIAAPAGQTVNTTTLQGIVAL
jgi:lipoprotein-anchoring transpeptidase ErfK/SrfK